MSNKKIFLSTLTFMMLGAISVGAAPVTIEQALQSAQQFVANGPLKAPKQGGNSVSLAYEARSKAGEADYYVFNRGANDGFVLVSGDDRTVPVLGYSDNGSFDFDKVPDNMRWWLSQYQKELQTLRDNPNARAHKPTKVARKVNPLIPTMWNQTSPYNAQCPTFTLNNATNQAVTGCVATAMAQVMYYHRWPDRGTGSISYSCDVGQVGVTQQLSANFSQSVYDWNNMLLEYDSNSSQTAINAVARLMRDAGYSVEMNYKRSSSGAQTSKVINALTSYFKYDPDLYIIYRDYFGITGWEQKLRDELDARRPIFYAGQSSEGGHAFVVDGYTTDGYFHINWGWGGMSNGYFVITMLNPNDQGVGSFDGGYNEGQQAIVGIKPDDGVTDPMAVMGFYDSFSANQGSVNLGGNATFTADAIGFFGKKNWNTLKWGVCIMSEDESTMVVSPSLNLDMSDIYTMQYFDGIELGCAIPGNLKKGIYHVKLVYSANDLPHAFFYCTSDGPAYVKMEVKADGKAYFNNVVTQPNLSLVSLSASSTTLYTNHPFEITADVKNDGIEYNGNMYFALLQNGVKKVTGTPMLVNIAQDGTKTINSQLTAPSTTGQYQLAMFDANNNQVGNSIAVTVEAASDHNLSMVSNLTVPSSVMPADEIEASVQLSNSGGPFMGSIEMFLLPLEGNSINSILASDLVTIPTGETVTVNFKCAVGAVIGSSYRLWLRNPNPEYVNSYYVWGSPVTITIGDYPVPLLPGDVDASGVVDVADVTILINIILTKDNAANYGGRADINGDGKVDAADINQVINYILGRH